MHAIIRSIWKIHLHFGIARLRGNQKKTSSNTIPHKPKRSQDACSRRAKKKTDVLESQRSK